MKGDITRQEGLDAIVSTITPDFDMGRSLNTMLLTVAGEDLDEFILENIYKPRPGDCFAVPGFSLPVKHVIFVVMPKFGRNPRISVLRQTLNGDGHGSACGSACRWGQYQR